MHKTTHALRILQQRSPLDPQVELQALYDVIEDLANNCGLTGLRNRSSGWHALWAVLNGRKGRQIGQAAMAVHGAENTSTVAADGICRIKVATPAEHNLAVGFTGPTWSQFVQLLLEHAAAITADFPRCCSVCEQHPHLPWPHGKCPGPGRPPLCQLQPGDPPPTEVHLVIGTPSRREGGAQ